MYMRRAALLLWLSLAGLAVGDPVLVHAPVGSLQGLESTATNGHKFLAFTGIPYAKAPVGPLRFAKPEPHPPLDGVFDATRPAPYCPHPAALLQLDDMPAGQEDCLFLNVFLQRLPSADKAQSESTTTSTSTTRNPTMTTAGAKKKVLVWVHGGGFIAGGASDYPPGSFVTSQDVILVSVNYRLGVLGFLSTENQAGPGNYGMWDQVMALRWVKENIAAFGGDPDDVTISGESAGGSAVSFLSLSPWARGLFTKVYPMSGAATSVFAIALGAQDHAAEIGRSTGCLGKDLRAKLSLAHSEDLMECLRGLSLEEITKLSPFTLERAQFVPRVDGDFLPLHPSKLLRDDQYLESIGFFNRTYLLSVTNSERAIMQGAVDSLELGINSQEGVSEEDKAAQIKRLHDSTYGFYLGARVASPSDALLAKVTDWYNRRLRDNQLATLVSDLTFIVPTYDFLNAVARSKTTDAYLLYFNHYPGFMRGQHRGIVHAGDLLYWFDIRIDKWDRMLHAGMDGQFDSEDRHVQMMFSDLVGEFMKTGNPGRGLQEVLPGGWPPYDLRGDHYLDLSPRPVVRRHLDQDTRDLWMVSVPAWAATDRL